MAAIIPVSIDHDRLIAIRWVVKAAAKYVNVTERNSAYEDWEKALKTSASVIEGLTRVHIRDAHENGACEICDPDAFALAQRRAEHQKELEDFDRQLTGGKNELPTVGSNVG